jgi:hypothetical protein
LDTYGLDTYGLDTYCLDTHGLDTYGLDTHGWDTYGLDTHGLDTYGLDTHGLDTYGLDTHGLDTYGLDTCKCPNKNKSSHVLCPQIVIRRTHLGTGATKWWMSLINENRHAIVFKCCTTHIRVEEDGPVCRPVVFNSSSPESESGEQEAREAPIVGPARHGGKKSAVFLLYLRHL